MSQGFNFIVRNNSKYVVLLQIDGGNNNCLDTEFIDPNPFLGQQFVVLPSGEFKAHLYRKDGHGCDGCQGEFQARPTFIVGNNAAEQAYQQFSFDSHGSIALVGTVPTFGSTLTQAGPAADAIWTIIFNRDH